MKKNVLAPWPHYGRDEIAAVSRVLRSGKVNQWTGQEVFSFEKEYAHSLGVKYAVALANGSVALDVALMALGIGQGDEVIVPSRSFVASASCVAFREAVPVFSDVDVESQNMTVKTIESLVTKRTKAVIVVHLAGWPADLGALRAFCDEKKIYLIEDCAQAHGAMYRGKPAGSFGDVSCFSFCQDKIITTGGEGGLLATNHKWIWEKAWSIKDHGRDYAFVRRKNKNSGFVWSVSRFGSNYRMTEMQAAIGRIMLKKLDFWVRQRRKLAAILTNSFRQFAELRVVLPPERVYHSYYKYYVFTKNARSGLSRDKIRRFFVDNGIPCGIGVCPEIYREKAFLKYWSSRMNSRRFPVARQLGETGLMFPVHPTLKEADMFRIISLMKDILGLMRK